MITSHHLDDSRSQRVLWSPEELALDYVVRHHDAGRLVPDTDTDARGGPRAFGV
jgi:hypothetical protein